MTKNKILITGCSGFIGSYLTKKLLKDYVVIGIDINKTKINHKNFHFHQIDIRDQKVEEIFKEHNIYKVIHLAALAGVRNSFKFPQEYADVNVKGLVNILELSKKYKIKGFIFSSSSSVYGNCPNTPWSEHEKDLQPISPYASSKLAGEIYCKMYSKVHNMNIIVLRFFSNLGPNGRRDMAPYLFIDAILKGNPIKKFGDGSMARDWCYVGDTVKGIISVLTSKALKRFEIINLGTGYPITLNELIKIIEEITNKTTIIKKYPKPKGDVNITYANISKANNLLNYDPKVQLIEGLKKFYENDFTTKNKTI